MFNYTPDSAPLITRLKFNGQLLLSALLGNLLVEYVREVYQEKAFPEAIIPIPLHRKRLWKRGFNQSIELARPLSKQLNLPLEIDLLSKSRHVVAQSGLEAKKRRSNVRNVFSVASHNYMHVVLFDDVVTTGATVNEAAKALKAGGVKRVDVWCVARTH
jgi:ComF family protein